MQLTKQKECRCHVLKGRQLKKGRNAAATQGKEYRYYRRKGRSFFRRMGCSCYIRK
jgi:hypothetical protein